MAYSCQYDMQVSVVSRAYALAIICHHDLTVCMSLQHLPD